MSNDSGATGEITLNERPELLARMRRLEMLQKDAKGEYFETTYNAKPIRFYVGYAKRLPLEWVKALVGFGGSGGYGMGMIMHTDEACPQCKAKGSLQSGICFHCKGMKYVETGKIYHIFKMVSQDDPTNFDTENQPLRKLGDVAEAASALA